LPSNFINSIAFNSGYIWLGTESGLCRFNPKDKTMLTFSSILPLSVFSFNKSAVFSLKNGKLAWGTNNGAVLFSPESLEEIPAEGKIFIHDISISGRSIRELPTFKLESPVDSLKEIKLKYFQNTINLELIPLGISSGAKFSWKLEGLDADWTVPADNRIITYTNLPSGSFVLKIRMLDSSMTQLISERSVSIHLVPPFWLTGWFLVLVVVILATIVFLYLMYYVNKLKQKHTEEKVRFFTNTAHDIRTSLTLIKAPVEELTKEHNISETGKYYLQLANEQSQRLSAVVTQLMDYQKADVGKEHLSLAMTDVVNLISNRCILFGSLAKNNQIELVFHSDTESYLSAIDEQKMEKIIDNLISNAIKYSHPESKVFIDLKFDDKKWSLLVKDQGIGIGKKAQRQLFREFYRGDNAINSKVVGSGIGLLLVKNYVSLHGGTISCTSQENVGSEFQVTIPYKKVETIIPVQSTYLAEFNEPEMVLISSDIQENDHSKEFRILIVEDNDDLRKFMYNALGQEFSIFMAKDGADAWEKIRKQIPDLVVSDIMMPGMDGFELCRLMKSTYETSHIPIILLTALTGKSEQMHGLGLGADDYLTKPFDMGILSQRIKTIIRNRGVVREKAFRLIKGETADPSILENELNDKFLKKILEVARLNISNSEFTKDEFASSLNMSASLLFKKIKSLTGLSPTDFIKTVRLDHALVLLKSRKYTVTEVSELCGFASVGYFSTVFKKHFGKSPTEILE
jgi:signal transduction histidine kinase/DNA-binding response OmpR family regulator